ncbi:hypothetical protein Tco_1400378 [Tanacetum coccineum]
MVDLIHELVLFICEGVNLQSVDAGYSSVSEYDTTDAFCIESNMHSREGIIVAILLYGYTFNVIEAFNNPLYFGVTKSDKESWGNSGEEEDDDDDEDDIKEESDNDSNDDEGDNDVNDDDSDDERTESERDKNSNLNQSNKEHEEEDKEYVDEFTDEEDDAEYVKEETEEELVDAEELYKDVNVNLRKEDVEMTDVDQGGAHQHNVSQESGFEQEEEDAYVTLIAVHDTQKTEGPMQSSSVSSDFTKKLLNFKNVSPADNEIASLMDTNVRHEVPSGHTSSLFIVPITVIPKITSAFATTIPPPPPSFNPLPQQATLTPTPTVSEATTSFPALPNFSYVVRFNDRVTNLERDLITRSCCLSKEKSTYEAAASLSEFELTKILMDKMEEHKSYLRADYKRELYDTLVKSYNTNKDFFDTYGESAHTEEPSHTVDDSGVQQNKEFDMGTMMNNLMTRLLPRLTDDPPTSFDELMDTPINFFVFVMNRLNIINLTQELLVGLTFNLLKGICKSCTELEYHFKECFKATTERLEWHNPEGKQYPFDLRPKRQQFYEFVSNRMSSKDVYSRKRIIVITSLKIMKRYDYGHLDKIEVPREDQQLYKFKEGDFPRLRLQDIEDMLLLLVQQKLTNLMIDECFDLNVALRMFSRRIVNQRRVEYLQLGIKSYQKKLTITKPDAFSDGTLNDVQTALHDITSRIRMEYLPKKAWSRLDKRRACVMIHDIDKQLFQRRLMQNLEKFVGGREYGEDLRLLTRTI